MPAVVVVQTRGNIPSAGTIAFAGRASATAAASAVGGSGAVYYISPTGGGTVGSITNPCAISRLSTAGVVKPGDTWILLSGTYPPVTLNGSSGVLDGTASQPITIRAASERQARLLGNGSTIVLSLANLSYWTFEGLQVQNGDLNQSPHDNVNLNYCDHITFRRCLFHHSNQGTYTGSVTGYNNDTLVMVFDSSYCLFEENEFWDCGRNMLQFANYDAGYGYHTARRNYFNLGDAKFRAGSGVTLYPSSGCLVENNFLDQEHIDQQGAYSYGPRDENSRFLANIGMNDYLGFEQAREFRPTDAIWQNNVAKPSGSYIGFYIRASDNTLLENNTVIGGAGNYVFDEQIAESGGAPETSSLVSKNNLGLSGVNYGFSAQDTYAPNWTSDHDNEYGATGSGNFVPATSDSRYTSPTQVAPGTAQSRCPAFILPSGPYWGAGADGSNIGATILYTTEDGVETTDPLWDTTTGEIRSEYIGAVVTGVNDGSQGLGGTLSDFGSRLHPTITAADFQEVYSLPSSVSANAGHGTATATAYGFASTYETIILTDSPTFVLPLDEASGTVTDIVGSKTATLYGSPTYGVTGPVTGHTAMGFDGVDDYLTVADHADLDLGNGPLSVELWMKCTGSLNWTSNLIAKGTQAPAILRTGTTGILSFYSLAWDAGTVSTVGITDTTDWHHVVGTKDSSNNWKVYVDGTDVSSGAYTTTTTNTATDLYIGASSYPNNYFTGGIAYVALYKSVLSAARVLAHYDARSAGGGGGGGGTEGTLQELIDATPSGGTLDATGLVFTEAATVNKPITIIGGSLTVPANTSALTVTANDVTIDGMTITGTNYATWQASGRGIWCATSISNLTITGCTISNFGNSAIWLDRVTNVYVGYCDIDDVHYAGIMLCSATGGVVEYNTVTNVPGLYINAGETNAYGIALSANITTSIKTTNVIVQHNTVETIPLWHGLDTHSGVDCTFRYNTTRGCSRAMFIDSSYGSATRITVTGNSFESPSPATWNLVAVTLAYTTDCDIIDNEISADYPSVNQFAGEGNVKVYDYQLGSTSLTVSGNTLI